MANFETFMVAPLLAHRPHAYTFDVFLHANVVSKITNARTNEANEALYECRYALKFTYVFAFYLPTDGNFRMQFEMNQTELERQTEEAEREAARREARLAASLDEAEREKLQLERSKAAVADELQSQIDELKRQRSVTPPVAPPSEPEPAQQRAARRPPQLPPLRIEVQDVDFGGAVVEEIDEDSDP